MNTDSGKRTGQTAESLRGTIEALRRHGMSDGHTAEGYLEQLKTPTCGKSRDGARGAICLRSPKDVVPEGGRRGCRILLNHLVPDPLLVLSAPLKPDVGEAPFAGVSLAHPIPARRRVAVAIMMHKLFIINVFFVTFLLSFMW